MSIYCTLWSIKLPRRYIFDDEWVEVCGQAVPPHIGHPREYPEGDPYADFLPPVVMEYDEQTGKPYRAVVIVQEGRDRKDIQRYVDPLLVLTGEEYESVPFGKLLNRIIEALNWDPDVCGYKLLPNGEKQITRRSQLPHNLRRELPPRHG